MKLKIWFYSRFSRRLPFPRRLAQGFLILPFAVASDHRRMKKCPNQSPLNARQKTMWIEIDVHKDPRGLATYPGEALGNAWP